MRRCRIRVSDTCSSPSPPPARRSTGRSRATCSTTGCPPCGSRSCAPRSPSRCWLGGLALFSPERLRVARADVPKLAWLGIAGIALVHASYFAAIARIDIGVALVIQSRARAAADLAAGRAQAARGGFAVGGGRALDGRLGARRRRALRTAASTRSESWPRSPAPSRWSSTSSRPRTPAGATTRSRSCSGASASRRCSGSWSRRSGRSRGSCSAALATSRWRSASP